MKKRGRKKGSGYRITREELFQYWKKSRLCQGMAQLNVQYESKRKAGEELPAEIIKRRDQGVQRMFDSLAIEGMDLLLRKAESLPEVRRFREQRASKDALTKKELSYRLDVSRQTLHARKKRRVQASTPRRGPAKR